MYFLNDFFLHRLHICKIDLVNRLWVENFALFLLAVTLCFNMQCNIMVSFSTPKNKFRREVDCLRIGKALILKLLLVYELVSL